MEEHCETGMINLSVIVPIFNAEDYILECLESLLCQYYPDMEIILVDDGSNDSTVQILEGHIDENNNRLKLIKKEHSGIALTRLRGVREARGKYVTFVDADDWIDPDTYQVLMQMCDEENLDLLASTYMLEDGKNRREIKHLYQEGLYTKEGIRNNIMPTMMFDHQIRKRRLDPHLGCKIIKKNLYLRLANDLSESITIGEDAYISYPLLFLVNNMCIYNHAFYHYRVNPSSYMKRMDVTKYLEIEQFYKAIRDKFTQIGVLGLMADQVDCYTRIVLASFIKERYGMNMFPVQYRFPYECFKPGDKIAIFGAGNVGESYVSELLQNRFLKIAGWIDSDYQSKNVCCGMKAVPPSRIDALEYDYILIAVAARLTAEEIREYLLKRGIEKKKIVWAETEKFTL